MKAILDGSFMMKCVRKEIDFLTQLKGLGMKVSILKESLQELKDARFASTSSRQDHGTIRTIFTIIDREHIEKKSTGQQAIGKWLAHQSRKGFYIGTADHQVRNTIAKEKLIQIHDNKNLCLHS